MIKGYFVKKPDKKPKYLTHEGICLSKIQFKIQHVITGFKIEVYEHKPSPWFTKVDFTK